MFYVKSYTEAKSIQEALELIQNMNSQIIAGGTDILVKSREGKKGYVDKDWVGIMAIEELKTITQTSEGDIFIGGTATFSEVEHHPLIQKYLSSLGCAAGTAGGPQLRNAGTIGGNICNGATSADTAATLLVYEANVVVLGLSGEKEIPIEDFYLGPGKVKLKQGELVKGFLIKKENFEGYKGHYIKFSQRKAMDIATLGCSVLLKCNESSIESMKIAFGVAGPTPLRVKEAEAFAKGLKLTNDNFTLIGKKCLEGTLARDSWRASKAFREQLILTLPIQCMEAILGGQANESNN